MDRITESVVVNIGNQKFTVRVIEEDRLANWYEDRVKYNENFKKIEEEDIPLKSDDDDDSWKLDDGDEFTSSEEDESTRYSDEEEEGSNSNSESVIQETLFPDTRVTATHDVEKMKKVDNHDENNYGLRIPQMEHKDDMEQDPDEGGVLKNNQVGSPKQVSPFRILNNSIIENAEPKQSPIAQRVDPEGTSK
ncbi:hypothetical protein L2E82_17509 [Cichorium intybus]|uniref:Uncharacterized protein n=1 Tax=Cichorium intybus TaxID=13427 RepID=A0ACB9F8Y1_CICIN|nr:hypothetical protein L2E82_17509 [Cichorium intybus]